jgi:translation initiation factor eIF-2B subunit epsilon
MAPSKASAAAAAASSKENDDLLDPQKLQAVILADSFLNTFKPLSLDTPKVLCPLNNVTLLDYAMDFLAGNGVEEVYVVCTNDALEKDLAENQAWQGRLEVTCIKDTSLTNAGDALRELYKRNVVQSDPFLLLFGDVVTNMDLTKAMEDHKIRHQNDSAAIMTLVLKETGGSAYSSIQSAASDLVVGLDTSTGGDTNQRVLLYDNQASASEVRLPCSFLRAHAGVAVRTDLMDTGVGICSPDVLGRFEDEFDYLDIQQDFVTNCVAEEEEGLQTRIHAHVLPSSQYAARIVDLATYHSVSSDLLRRWCYPIVADNLHSTPQLYKWHDWYGNGTNYQYKETLKPSKVARSSTIQGPGMLGSKCTIGEDATIRSSIIGHHVQIGAGVTVTESHIWDHVQINEGATVVQSILAQNVIIQKGAVVSKGCVIGQGCVIGENVVLPEYTRITLCEEEVDPFGDDADGFDDDDDSDGDKSTNNNNSNDEPITILEETDTDTAVVGPDGKGRVWEPSLEDDDDSDDDDEVEPTTTTTISSRRKDPNTAPVPSPSPMQLQSIGFDLETYYNNRVERQAEPENDGLSEKGQDELEAERMETEAFSAYTEGAFTFVEDTPFTTTPMTTTTTGGGGGTEPMVFGRQKGVDVVQEFQDICLEFEESSPMENLAIELNSYKFSQNASYADCCLGATLAIVHKMEITSDMTDGKLVGALKARLEFWAPLLQKLSMGQAEEKAIVYALERVAIAPGPVGDKLKSGLSFRFLLQTMHDQEVLSEEAILAWAEERKKEPDDSPMGKLFHLASIQAFLEWLEEESEEEESDEDS